MLWRGYKIVYVKYVFLIPIVSLVKVDIKVWPLGVRCPSINFSLSRIITMWVRNWERQEISLIKAPNFLKLYTIPQIDKNLTCITYVHIVWMKNNLWFDTFCKPANIFLTFNPIVLGRLKNMADTISSINILLWQ